MTRANPDAGLAPGPYRGAMLTLAASASAPPQPLFGSVLCVTGRSGTGAEAVRQAALLAGAGAAFDLLDAPAGADEVLDRCAGHDLLVLPAGPLASAVLPRSPVPVLVTRPAPRDGDFPGSVLIAVDATPEAHAASRFGARLAARDGALLALVAAPEHDAWHRRALEAHVATVERISGRRPLVLDEYGPAARSIAIAAANLEASLILLGGRAGRPAASVSAAVAEHARCSVLVLRP